MAILMGLSRMVNLIVPLSLFQFSVKMKDQIRQWKGEFKDQSLQFRLARALTMIEKGNPEFFEKLDKNVGVDIRKLLEQINIEKAVKSGNLHLQEKYIEKSIRNIFQYVIKDAVGKEDSYEPVSLLISIWTKPQAFNQRYEAIKEKYERRKQEKLKEKSWFGRGPSLRKGR